jgi:acyl carrier protein phosphodiesterase
LADHFLAINLEADNHKLPGYPDFGSYRTWLYTLLEQHKEFLSVDAQRFFAHVKHTDLLVGYADWARLHRVIEHVCKRLGRPQLSAPMVAAMQSQLDNLALDFEAYWPALNAEAQRFISAAE